MNNPADLPEFELELRIYAFVETGRINQWTPAQNAIKQLVSRDQAAADQEACRWESMRVSQNCDLNHLPINAMTRKQRDDTKDYVDRCEIVIKWLVDAGARQPPPAKCFHEERSSGLSPAAVNRSVSGATASRQAPARAVVTCLVLAGLFSLAVVALILKQRAQVAASPQGNSSPYALYGFVVGVMGFAITALTFERLTRRAGQKSRKGVAVATLIFAVALFILVSIFAAHRSLSPTGLGPAQRMASVQPAAPGHLPSGARRATAA